MLGYKTKNKWSNKWSNKFTHFCKKILSSKHSYWFECLNFQKRKRLFIKWEEVRFSLNKEGKTPSLNKFLFNSRRSKTFYINPSIIRDKAINKILDI